MACLRASVQYLFASICTLGIIAHQLAKAARSAEVLSVLLIRIHCITPQVPAKRVFIFQHHTQQNVRCASHELLYTCADNTDTRIDALLRTPTQKRRPLRNDFHDSCVSLPATVTELSESLRGSKEQGSHSLSPKLSKACLIRTPERGHIQGKEETARFLPCCLVAHDIFL
jgi:hypothetical protein